MSLNELIQGYERAVVSLQGKNGYPVSFSVEDFKIKDDKILAHNPRGLHLDVDVGHKGCILFHAHNKYIKGLRSVSFYGFFTKVDAEYLEFKPHSHYGFKQGGLLNTLRFVLNGKRRAKKYLRERTRQKT